MPGRRRRAKLDGPEPAVRSHRGRIRSSLEHVSKLPGHIAELLGRSRVCEQLVRPQVGRAGFDEPHQVCGERDRVGEPRVAVDLSDQQVRIGERRRGERGEPPQRFGGVRADEAGGVEKRGARIARLILGLGLFHGRAVRGDDVLEARLQVERQVLEIHKDIRRVLAYGAAQGLASFGQVFRPRRLKAQRGDLRDGRR